MKEWMAARAEAEFPLHRSEGIMTLDEMVLQSVQRGLT